MSNSVHLDDDIQDLIKKFSEHYHDAWASKKLESGWSYGETWSGEEKLHPRLKPFNMLSDYVSVCVCVCAFALLWFMGGE